MFQAFTVNLLTTFMFNTTNLEAFSPFLELTLMLISLIENHGFKAKEFKLQLELQSISATTLCIIYTLLSIR